MCHIWMELGVCQLVQSALLGCNCSCAEVSGDRYTCLYYHICFDCSIVHGFYC
ncbi:hypothetical protein M758_1G038300 [Ceratodon purpureus]|nr:hypothetical protein M758_1G038300 [Ceratodon purpureus]